MSFTGDAVKELVVESMKTEMIAAYGAELGGQYAAAYSFLMFGGFGVPGLVDGAALATRANAEAVNELTEDLAMSLVKDLARMGLTELLEASVADSLLVAGLVPATVAAVAVLLVSGLLESTSIGAEPPIPPTLNPPTPGPPIVPTPDPGPPDPEPPDPEPPDPGPPDPGQPDPGQPDPGLPDPGLPDPGPPGADPFPITNPLVPIKLH